MCQLVSSETYRHLWLLFLFSDKQRSIGSSAVSNRLGHTTSLACQVPLQSPLETSTDWWVILCWPELALLIEQRLRSVFLVDCSAIVIKPVRICVSHARVHIPAGSTASECILGAELRARSRLSRVHNSVVVVLYEDLAWDFGHWFIVRNDRTQQYINIIPFQLPSTRVNNLLFHPEQVRNFVPSVLVKNFWQRETQTCELQLWDYLVLRILGAVQAVLVYSDYIVLGSRWTFVSTDFRCRL